MKVSLEYLIRSLDEDDEIIVIDGQSTDGTAEYLQSLYDNGDINQLVIEPDYCQAHGTNKGMLLARGEIIKIITDDDYYNYAEIKKCKQYMINNPEVDVLNANIAAQFTPGIPFRVIKEREKAYRLWSSGEGKPFWFSDHGLFIRRNKLPLVGLWDTNVICIDVEYTLRMTASHKINLVWYTGIVCVALVNQYSNFNRFADRVKNDTDRICHYYIDDYHPPVTPKPAKDFRTEEFFLTESIEDSFSFSEQWLLSHNNDLKLEFLYSKQAVSGRLLS